METQGTIPLGSSHLVRGVLKTQLRKPVALWLRLERALTAFDLSLSTAIPIFSGNSQRQLHDLLQNEVYCFLDDSEPHESLGS
jgi:hypothetical protein